MKLYYSPGACSLATNIVLREAGLAFTPVLASTKTHKLEDGTDYYSLNPKGYVPLLELDDGQRLTECQVILQYAGDRVPDKKLVAPWGSMERYRQLEWLSFISSELHKTIGALFNPALPSQAREQFRTRGASRLQWVNEQLQGKQFLMGDAYSVVDAYLFTVANWTKFHDIDISSLSNLGGFMARVAARPAVQEALKAEGLIK